MGKIYNFLQSNWGILALIVYIINIVLVIYFNPHNVMTDFTRTVTFFIIFAGFFNLLLWYYFNNNPSIPKNGTLKYLLQIGKILSVLFIFYSFIYAIFYYVVFTPWPLTILVTILNVIIAITSLALVYKYFSNKFQSSGKSSNIGIVLELIKNIVFFLPCLLIEFVDYIKYQYKITTKTVWLILLIEIIIIALRFSLPFLYKIYNKTDGNLIKKGPIYLNNVKDLGAFQNKKPDQSTAKKEIFNYNYAISSWIWINPQPESTSPAYSESTTLLNYGNVLKINFNKNKLEFLALTTKNTDEPSFDSNKEVKIYELKNIPYQKWNNIVLNYSGGTLDIFINNSLVSSNINITPIMYYNKVISGANNGINGGIRDIVYYDKVLTKNDIYSIYNVG